MDLPKLNLPESKIRITVNGDETFVWDIVRKKNIFLTPEEWVRQNFLHLLIYHLDYPRSLIKVESGLTYNQKRKRSDITVRKTDGTVFLLVECKSHHISIDHKSLQQISIYNKTLRADHVAITNGNRHFFWEFDGTRYRPLKEAPIYNRQS